MACFIKAPPPVMKIAVRINVPNLVFRNSLNSDQRVFFGLTCSLIVAKSPLTQYLSPLRPRKMQVLASPMFEFSSIETMEAESRLNRKGLPSFSAIPWKISIFIGSSPTADFLAQYIPVLPFRDHELVTRAGPIEGAGLPKPRFCRPFSRAYLIGAF